MMKISLCQFSVGIVNTDGKNIIKISVTMLDDFMLSFYVTKFGFPLTETLKLKIN